MRSELAVRISALALAVVMVSCSAPPRPSAAAGTDVVAASSPAASGVPSVVETWFDPATAQELIEARRDFDRAELSAIAEFDERMGQYGARVSMPIEQYRDQVSSAALRQRGWSAEQRRRSALASGPRNAAVDEAEAKLQRRTLAALKRFFAQELKEGRVSPADYDRLIGGELGANYFPSIRRRKWAGPTVIAFRAPIRTPEYRHVLQEVRMLWAAEARRARVEWVEPGPGVYSSLFAPSRAGTRPGL